MRPYTAFNLNCVAWMLNHATWTGAQWRTGAMAVRIAPPLARPAILAVRLLASSSPGTRSALPLS
jgi:hypothetical protein